MVRALFGRRAAAFLSYEAVFLRSVLWLVDGTQPPASCRGQRCSIFHYARCDNVSNADRFCAAFGLLLVKTKLDDEAADSGRLGRWLSRLGHYLYRDSFEEATVELNRLAPGIPTQVKHLIETHRANEQDHSFGGAPEEFSRPSSEAFGECFRHAAIVAGRPQDEEVLYALGEHLGRFMVAADALEDFPADRRSGRPNPLIEHPEWREALLTMTGASPDNAIALIESLPNGRKSVPVKVMQPVARRWRSPAARQAKRSRQVIYESGELLAVGDREGGWSGGWWACAECTLWGGCICGSM